MELYAIMLAIIALPIGITVGLAYGIKWHRGESRDYSLRHHLTYHNGTMSQELHNDCDWCKLERKGK